MVPDVDPPPCLADPISFSNSMCIHPPNRFHGRNFCEDNLVNPPQKRKIFTNLLFDLAIFDEKCGLPPSPSPPQKNKKKLHLTHSCTQNILDPNISFGKKIHLDIHLFFIQTLFGLQIFVEPKSFQTVFFCT